MATMDPRTIEYSLGVLPAELDAFQSGASRMPAELRLRLASFALATYPEHVRAANRVAVEARAEMAFRETTTVTHLNSPPSRFR